MVGFQLSRVPGRAPYPLCALLLTWSARASRALSVLGHTSSVTSIAVAVVAGFVALLVAMLRILSADVYDALIVRMTTRWYAAVLHDIRSRQQAVSTAPHHQRQDHVSKQALRAEPLPSSSPPPPPVSDYRLLDVGVGTATALVAHKAS